MIMKKFVFFASVFVFWQGLYAQEYDRGDYIGANALKFAPMQVFAGELHFAYERRILTQISIEVCGGPTFWRRNSYELPRFDNFIMPNDPVQTENQNGWFLSVAPRFYLISVVGTAPKGLYLSPEFKLRNSNTVYKTETLGSQVSRLNEFTTKFISGYQFVFGRHFAMDLFFGLGFGTDFETDYHIDAYTTSPVTYGWRKVSDTNFRLVGAFGAKLGFVF